MQRSYLYAASAAMAAASFAAAGEPLIYATNHQGLFPDFGDTLIRFSPSDPEGYETIGPMGNNLGFGGLEFDGDGNLWAYASYNSFGGASSGLYSVDLETGAATVQGSPSMQTLADLAWNPVENAMFGVYSQGFATSRLYQVNLETGAVSVVGTFSGLDTQHNLIGVGIDSQGTVFVFDNMNNKIYKSDANLALTLVYDSTDLQCENCELAVGDQGIGIDWSRNDQGYHGASGQGEPPNYYGTINQFSLDGSSYIWGDSFGPNLGDGPFFPPQVQAGDVAIVPDLQPQVPGDLTGDGVVDVSDLLALLSAWGPCPRGNACAADLTGDGVIDVSDLLLLLSNWG